MTAEARLILGDAAIELRSLAPASVDMTYMDPPFGTEVVWRGNAGSFNDRWRDSTASAEGWARLNLHCPAGAAVVLAAACVTDQRAYIGAMSGIILGVHRVLKRTGTLWLHFDDTAGALLRLLCTAIFGSSMEVGTLVWRRTRGGHANAKGFGRIHDTIACYARSDAALWRLWRLGTIGGDPCSPNWQYRFAAFAASEPMGPNTKERVGYPTQKPAALLEELIGAATLPGNLVLDATCGSGTSLVAARNLGRRAIGIDCSSDAIATARNRLAVPAQSAFQFGGAA